MNQRATRILLWILALAAILVGVDNFDRPVANPDEGRYSEISREMGTRHRAAIGITEGSDAISIVVSEETGLITYVDAGNLIRNVDTQTLKKLLLEAMEIPATIAKREPAKAMKEAESEITVG